MYLEIRVKWFFWLTQIKAYQNRNPVNLKGPHRPPVFFHEIVKAYFTNAVFAMHGIFKVITLATEPWLQPI